MTDYTKSTNFATKDALLSGNPLKIVKGTEIDTEFNNIATAVSTKADSTQVATDIDAAITAAVTSILDAAYPVGSIYTNASVSTNPGTLLGFGTWVAFGEGRVAVGYKSGDALFGTAGNTGGSADAVLVSHSHTVTDPGHHHTISVSESGSGSLRGGYGSYVAGNQTGTTTTGISLSTDGVSATNANLPPYITVYMWKRTA